MGLLLLLLGIAALTSTLLVATCSVGGCSGCLALPALAAASSWGLGLLALSEHQLFAIAARHPRHRLRHSQVRARDAGKDGQLSPLWASVHAPRSRAKGATRGHASWHAWSSCPALHMVLPSPTFCRRFERILAKRSRLVRKESMVSWLCGRRRNTAAGRKGNV